jgi:hypothetical protein
MNAVDGTSADGTANEAACSQAAARFESERSTSTNVGAKAIPASQPFPRSSAWNVAGCRTDEIAGNAATHSEIPAILDEHRREWYQRQFENELQPLGFVELVLVADLARQAAAMERWDTGSLAIQREAARALPQFDLSNGSDPGTFDAVLAGAMCADVAERSEVNSRSRSRAFHRTLNKLEEVQQRRKQLERLGRVVIPPPFADEAACREYLERRLRDESFRCTKCGSAGYFLPSRRMWECQNCRKQHTLRTGTVMAGSGLPLLAWFEAIRQLLARPTTGTAELAERLQIRRPATVRNLAKRIRSAMTADDASERLAGLDHYYFTKTELT